MTETTENYNETVLIPILQKRVNSLTSDTLLLEAKLEISEKQKSKLEQEIQNLKTQIESLNSQLNTSTEN